MYLKGICCEDYLTFKTKAPFNVSMLYSILKINVMCMPLWLSSLSMCCVQIVSTYLILKMLKYVWNKIPWELASALYLNLKYQNISM